MRKKFLLFLILEIAVTLSVIIIFKTIENRSFAGLFAGSLFTGLGAYIFIELIKTKSTFRFFSFYGVCIHLFFSAIPLILTRVLNWDIPHSDLIIFGMEAPLFHSIAEKIFVILMLCTLIDLMKTLLPLRSQK